MPEIKLIGPALKELRDKDAEDIFVIDEYGGVTGMITMHDIAEEVAGDLATDKGDDKPFMMNIKTELIARGELKLIPSQKNPV